MRIILSGPPIPKLRPRFFRGKVCDLQEEQKNFVRLLMQKRLQEAQESQERQNLQELKELSQARAFDVSFVFTLGVANSLSKRRKNAKLKGLEPCNIKPDLDNLIKFYLDCANGIFFEDDRLVVNLNAKKIYGEKPSTEMTILPIKQEV